LGNSNFWIKGQPRIGTGKAKNLCRRVRLGPKESGLLESVIEAPGSGKTKGPFLAQFGRGL